MNGIERRGFLRTLGLRAVAGAVPQSASAGAAVGAGAIVAARPTARHPIRCLTSGELQELAAAEGLRLQAGQLVALARRSVRLTEVGPGKCVAEAWLDVPPDLEVTGRPGQGSAIVLQVDRSAVALAGTRLAGFGVLAVTLTGPDNAVRAVGQSHVLSVDVHHRDERPPAVPSGSPLCLGAHLQLPRVWSDPVQALGFDVHDQAAYARVRDRLAEAQGLEVEQAGGAGLTLHRLLGYPDDTSGTLPGECAELAGPGAWTLLAQLSVGPAARIFVWTATDDSPRRAVGLLR